MLHLTHTRHKEKVTMFEKKLRLDTGKHVQVVVNRESASAELLRQSPNNSRRLELCKNCRFSAVLNGTVCIRRSDKQFHSQFVNDNDNMPSVLWRHWLGGRKGIRPVKTEWWVLAWLSVFSKVQMICIWSSCCHCHPIVSCSSKINNGLPFWHQLTQVVLEKRLLNGFSSSSSWMIMNKWVFLKQSKKPPFNAVYSQWCGNVWPSLWHRYTPH